MNEFDFLGKTFLWRNQGNVVFKKKHEFQSLKFICHKIKNFKLHSEDLYMGIKYAFRNNSDDFLL